jgi:hypothetical protein
MLFLGTEKYPSENDYHSFVSEHGGAFQWLSSPLSLSLSHTLSLMGAHG